MKRFLANGMVALMLLAPTAAMAQAGPGHQPTNIPHHPRVNEVNHRIDNQEKRIHQGVKNGTMTKAQAHKDQEHLKAINKEKHAMREADHGHLTKGDKKLLNHQLNHESKVIHTQKH
jgi:hypothetical protein